MKINQYCDLCKVRFLADAEKNLICAYMIHLRRMSDNLHTTTQSLTPKKVKALAYIDLYVFK